MFHTRKLSLWGSAGLAAFLCGSSPALAVATAPPLGAAQTFAVLGATAVTNTGPSIVTGDLGIHPNNLSSVTGFSFSTSPGPGIVIGATHFADAAALAAKNSTITAYNNLAGQPCDVGPLAPADLAGQTLVPGVYCYTSSVQISSGGVLHLNALGNNNAVWVFKVGSTFTTISAASVVFDNGGQDCNVFWQVGSSATLGTTSHVVGNILALASITLNTGATLSGRALVQTGAVTLDSNTISVCSAAGEPTPTPTLTPTPTPNPFGTPTPTPTPLPLNPVPGLSGQGTIVFVAILALLSFVAIRRLT